MKLLVTFLIALYQVTCWWENGHMMVAQIAEILLQKNSPKVYAFANDLVHAMNGLDSDIDNTFVTCASWPDDIKDKAMSFWNDWHYFDRPINPQGMYLTQNELQKEWNAHNCLSRAKTELTSVEKHTTTSKIPGVTLQKAVFIRYVIHVVGDVHQPLHSVTMFNETFPNGDLAGNFIKVTDYQGNPMNFHGFWDSGAEYLQPVAGPNPYERPFDDTKKTNFKKWAEELMQEYPEDHFNGLTKNIDYTEWTTESWKIAEEHSYPYIKDTNVLGQDYIDASQEIVKQRVVMGGYRLQYFLQDIYNELPEQYKSYYENQSQEEKVETKFLG